MRIPKHNEKKKNKKTTTCVNDEGVLTRKREQLFILTRKCFDVKFLADTFGISPVLVPRTVIFSSMAF